MEPIVTCKNCSRTFSGKFCPSCGQAANEGRLDWAYLKQFVKKLFYNFLDKGLLYSCKHLITKPGHTIRDYIEGKRIHHMNPFTLLISLAGLYGFIFHSYHINTFIEINSSEPIFSHVNFNKVNDWISSHFALSTGALIPLFTIGTRLAFIKSPYNYIEFFVLNTFIGACRIMVHFLFLPLLIYFKDTSNLQWIMDITSALDFIVYGFIILQFFNYQQIFKNILLVILSYFIFIVVYLLLILGVIELYNYFFY
jgi:hypothetical protein